MDRLCRETAKTAILTFSNGIDNCFARFWIKTGKRERGGPGGQPPPPEKQGADNCRGQMKDTSRSHVADPASASRRGPTSLIPRPHHVAAPRRRSRVRIMSAPMFAPTSTSTPTIAHTSAIAVLLVICDRLCRHVSRDGRLHSRAPRARALIYIYIYTVEFVFYELINNKVKESKNKTVRKNVR